jgi:hypothetical protein
VFQNEVLRRMFGLKREEVAGCWKTLRNEKLHNLYTLPNVISVINSMRLAGHVARMVQMRNAHPHTRMHAYIHTYIHTRTHARTHTKTCHTAVDPSRILAPLCPLAWPVHATRSSCRLFSRALHDISPSCINELPVVAGNRRR